MSRRSLDALSTTASTVPTVPPVAALLYDLYGRSPTSIPPTLLASPASTPTPSPSRTIRRKRSSSASSLCGSSPASLSGSGSPEIRLWTMPPLPAWKPAAPAAGATAGGSNAAAAAAPTTTTHIGYFGSRHPRSTASTSASGASNSPAVRRSKSVETSRSSRRSGETEHSSRRSGDDDEDTLLRLDAPSDHVVPQYQVEKDQMNVMNEIAKYAFNGAIFHSPQDDIFRTRRTRVLDIACGPGWWMRDFATAYPLAEVVGLDIDPEYFYQIALPPNCAFVAADGTDALPFDSGVFDFCFVRGMAGSIRADAYPRLLSEAKRVTRPGGYVEIVEPYNFLIKYGPFGKSLRRVMAAHFAARGIDYGIALKLDSLLHDAGLIDVTEEMKSVPVGWGGDIGEYTQFAVSQMMRIERASVMDAMGLATTADFEALRSNLVAELSDNRTRWNWYWACGRVPPSATFRF
ncbi:S-adenosyl-L-methionine-dependent methyltransferase [Zopfochytrium polystomum]|nr:S-adenosyl-L-methionine-dependent methyltransferase [Zopfochytrium polystomum]